MELRVGNLLILGFHGTVLPRWILDFEQRFGLGGVILFDRDFLRPGELRNIESREQVKYLCSSVHALPSRPLVFVDQEGGRVTRLKTDRGFQILPSAAEIASMDERSAREAVESSYAEMASLGIDFNLAPVVDLNSNPTNPNIGALGRAFSEQPAEVERCVSVFADAAKRVGLQLCLKHYPGLGGATTDSHLASTEIGEPIDEAQLTLFDELCRVIPGSAILSSHGIVEGWDPGVPVSVSSVASDRIRRSNPEALIITDDLQMQGLQDFCGTTEAGTRALAAGVDLLCIGNNLKAESDECLLLAEELERLSTASPEIRENLTQASARVEIRKDAARRGRAASES